jgi:hypothetical protein
MSFESLNEARTRVISTVPTVLNEEVPLALENATG